MIIRFDSEVVKQYPNIYDITQKNIIAQWISYIINSNTRKSVELRGWLKDQTIFEPEILKVAENIPNRSNYDEQMWEIMNYVQDRIVYQTDTDNWKANEYWEKASETIVTNKCDCEGGAILMYILARIKGIPANRLYIWAGNVQLNERTTPEGHCCLFYKPINYPYHFVSLDWCYNPTKYLISLRNIFEFNGNTIKEYKYILKINSIYKTTWFIFNEEFGCSKYNYKEAI